MATLVCPKCQGAMRDYERSGVTVDQCEDCRGIFLDRGELERLVDAEGGPQPSPPQGPPQPAGYPQQGYPQQPPPRRGFLEELFGEQHGYRRHHGGWHH